MAIEWKSQGGRFNCSSMAFLFCPCQEAVGSGDDWDCIESELWKALGKANPCKKKRKAKEDGQKVFYRLSRDRVDWNGQEERRDGTRNMEKRNRWKHSGTYRKGLIYATDTYGSTTLCKLNYGICKLTFFIPSTNWHSRQLIASGMWLSSPVLYRSIHMPGARDKWM